LSGPAARAGTIGAVPEAQDDALDDRLASLLAPDDDPPREQLSVEELRRRREQYQRVESALSFGRRLVQGRCDIVAAERARRAEGSPPLDLDALVARLPSILGERAPAASRGAIHPAAAPPIDILAVTGLPADLDAIVDARRLASLPELGDGQIESIAEALGRLERKVSDMRRSVHQRIDALQEEVVRRYQRGEVSVDALLR